MKKGKRTLALLLVMILAFGMTPAVIASAPMPISAPAPDVPVDQIAVTTGEILINGVQINAPRPSVKDGVILLPIRQIAEALDLAVTWQGNDRSVTIGDAYVLWIGKPQLSSDGGLTTREFGPAPEIIDGRTYVPISFFNFGLTGFSASVEDGKVVVNAIDGTSAASVTITDIANRSVTLPKPATKLVGTHNPTLNIAIILGGGGKYLVGFGNKNMAGNLYQYVYPELADDVPQVGMGRNVNIESCLAVGADLAILPQRFADEANVFENVGIPAAVILPNNESFETIKTSITLLGTLLGEDNRAKEINAYFDGKINAAKEIAGKADAQVKAIYLGSSSQLSVANGAMLQSLMLETAGAVNVAKDVAGSGGFIDVSVEEIIGWNPEIIYIPAYASYTVEDILSDAAWSSIQAVKDKKVFIFPSALEPWDYPTPSTSMGLMWLISNLYPELYSMDQVLDDANEYYELVYGQRFTVEQLGLR
ncbi:MAG: ABC transporter substrate-binding protein [Clostridiales bacterium]|nr:ABC transporter substrate-binding protein [Clostridiales bacterium]